MEKNQKKINSIERFFRDFKETITIAMGILIVITFFFGAANYVDNEIEKKITDETYLNRLAKILRPFAIFNKDGAIQYDHGAERYIQKIDVKSKKDGDYESIIITTKIFLQNAPLLLYYGYDNYAINCKRIDTNKWLFELSSPNLIAWGDKYQKIDPVFMIEITR